MKKTVLFIMASLLLMAAASGNGAQESGASGKMTEISVMLFDRANIPADQGTITDNRWTKYVNEEMAALNITVEFQPLPRSEEGTKIPVLMASGTASDIMMTYNNALVESYYKDGGTTNLAPYVSEEYASQLRTYLGEAVLKAGQTSNGEQFAIPARRSIYTIHNMFIRKDWLDTLGIEIPTTPDEFLIVMKAFRDNDPGNVGKEQLIAFGSGGDMLSHAFRQELDQTAYDINQVSPDYGDPGMKDYHRFRNTLYNEGLMDREYFAEKNFGQAEREAVVRGDLGTWISNTNANVDGLRGSLLQNLRKNIPEADFIGISNLKNIHDGQIHNESYPLTGGFNFVPLTAESPEACIKYMNFLAGDGGFTLFHGIEGEHFQFEDGVPVVIDGEYNAKTKDWGRHDFFLVGNQGYFATPEDFAKATSKEIPGYEQYVIDNYRLGGEGIVFAQSIYKTDLEIKQSGNLKKIKDDYSVKLTTCDPAEFDSLWNEYLTQLENYNIKEILAEREAYFKK